MSWKKGESGNPQGRPRAGHSIVASLSTMLSKRELVDENGKQVRKTKAQLVAENLLKIATGAEAAPAVTAAKEIMDRTEGKVPLPVRQQVSGQLTLPIITETFNLGDNEDQEAKPDGAADPV